MGSIIWRVALFSGICLGSFIELDRNAHRMEMMSDSSRKSTWEWRSQHTLTFRDSNEDPSKHEATRNRNRRLLCNAIATRILTHASWHGMPWTRLPVTSKTLPLPPKWRHPGLGGISQIDPPFSYGETHAYTHVFEEAKQTNATARKQGENRNS